MINAKTTNWCVVPWATEAWATVVHPELDPADALAKLNEELVYLLRLDEPDAAAAWRERGAQLQAVGARLTEHRFDALRFEGPGTDLTVGLLPTSRFAGGGSTQHRRRPQHLEPADRGGLHGAGSAARGRRRLGDEAA